MHLSRILLLIVLATAITGMAAPSAGAQAFEDNSCPYLPGTLIRICPDGFTGTPYSYQIVGREGSGCWPHVSFKAIGTIPPGITFSSGGQFSGIPTQPGEYTFWVAMQDIPWEEGGASWCADKDSTEELFRITIWQGLEIVQSQSTLPPGQLSTPYNFQFTTTGGGNPTWSVSAGSLPAGITLNSSTGLLSGTPTATGDFSFKITAADGKRSDTETYALSVVEPLRIATGLPAAEVGIPFTVDLQATGGKPAHTWAVEGTLPAGLSLDAATGVISGSPRAAGSYALKVKVTDTLGLTSTRDMVLKVAARLLLAKKALRAAHAGARYSALVQRLGGVGPFKWTIAGTVSTRKTTGTRAGAKKVAGLPVGLKLNSRTGLISGVPRKAGTYRFRVQVTDKLGATSTRTYLLKVLA